MFLFFRFDKHACNECPLPADLRSVCYKAVLKNGNEKTFDKMLELYRATDLHEEKDRISRALGSICDPEVLSKVIEFAMSVSWNCIEVFCGFDFLRYLRF